MAAEPTAPVFPNFMQMRARVPVNVWRGIRVLTVAAVLALCVTLFVRPDAGLFVLWTVIVPGLPVVFLVAPGLWRNICPLAAVNQTPRLFGFTRGLTLPARLQEYGYVIAITAFFVIASARKPLFDDNGPALAVLIIGLLSTAFLGGLVFKGKSGWCSSICPMLPVQRIYGQTPYATLRNSHCEPCVGCTKNCYDFNPSVAYLADQHERDPYYTGYRKFFAGAFPGFILAFYLVPNPPEISVVEMYLRFALYMIVSVGSLYALDSFVKVTLNKMTALYGATALNLYYWFAVPRVYDGIREFTNATWMPEPSSPDWLVRASGLSEPFAPEWLVWASASLVLLLTLVWVVRTYRKEPLFVKQAQQAAGAGPVRVGSARALSRHRESQSGRPEVSFMPEGRRIVVEPGRTLLELAESSELKIEAGCRMWMCGSDPVAILNGMENLSEIGENERATLDRLGLAENSRMACSAHVNGPLSVSLNPQRATAGEAGAIEDFKYDPAVKRVVIIGNGIGGVTAADHIRRRYPECQIDIVGREQHLLYNRMAISRLIYGRSAMQGPYLLPGAWYDERKITCWQNTQAARIDRDAREVELATGETLQYDRLILAMGSRSFVPPIEGGEIPGTFVLREAEDAMEIRAFVQQHRSHDVVVAGGGVIGLEAGYAVHKLGQHTSVLERGDRLMRRQLDGRSSRMLQDHLEGLGMDVVLQADVDSVQGNGRVRDIVLKDGRTLPCDLFLICAGIRSNVDLAVEAGLDVERGVVVDDQLRTSDPNIFAVGDVASYRGRTYGLWPIAVEQGVVAAINSIGGDKAYEDTVPSTLLKVVGVELTSIGPPEPESEDDIVIALEDVQEHRYRKIVVSEGRIVSAVLYGYQLEVPRVTDAIKKGIDVSDHLDALKAGDWDVLSKLAA